jgi:hypothetical protein
MAMRYIGTDTTCPNTNCPTALVDEADGSLVIQGYKLDAQTMGEVNATAPVQQNETVVRIPARTASILRGAMGDG